MKLSPGDVIDQKYRIVGLLGQGGMGSVYAAENVRIDRRVAIKVLHRISGPSDVARFEREARAAQVGSRNIVQVYDLGNLANGAPYMVMEYLSGESLGERILRKKRLNPVELVPIAAQILDGLAAAHRVGIVHRDLKPDNVFLVRDDGTNSSEVVKLLDFGISKFVDSARASQEPSLTKSGMAVGTPHYMSPEQVQGLKELDARSDLYSLGVILYQCLSGRLPFATEDVVPLLSQILLEVPEPLDSVVPDLDPGISAIVARAMARNVDNRYQTAIALREALLNWQTDSPGRSAPTAELPAVEVQGNAPLALLQRGLWGVALATTSAICVVGVATLVRGTGIPLAPVARATSGATSGGVIPDSRAAVTTTAIVTTAAAVTAAPPTTPPLGATNSTPPAGMKSSRQSGDATTPAVATATNAPSPGARLPATTAAAPRRLRHSLPPPQPGVTAARPTQVDDGDAPNRHVSRLPGE